MRKTPFYYDGVLFYRFFPNRSLTYLVIECITQLMNEYNLSFLPYPSAHAH